MCGIVAVYSYSILSRDMMIDAIENLEKYIGRLSLTAKDEQKIKELLAVLRTKARQREKIRRV
jgi:ribonuclease HIII